MRLDHLFIACDDPAAAERQLTDFGLTFGTRSYQPGQGTSNCCAYFDNAYLELIWQRNEDELQSDPVRRLKLWERLHWRDAGASPFGVAFREEAGDPPLSTWHYDAPFLPRGMGLPIVTPADSPALPLLFVIPASLPLHLGAPAEHLGKCRIITGVRISGPHASRMAAPVLAGLDAFTITDAPEPLLELELDHCTEGASQDFRPSLPLVIRR